MEFNCCARLEHFQIPPGALTPDRGFAGPGRIIDQSDGSIAPVSIKGRNAYLGLYISDTLDLTDALSRAPSPAELSCADPAAPCSLTNFFVGDPPLKQVVAHTFEAGGMGTAELEGDQHLSWQASLYRTDVSDDIELVASSVIGRGYFRNIAAALRQGLEASMRYDAEHFSATLGYSYTDATYLTGFALNSPENPKAGEDGLIFVRSGDHLPNIPTNVVKGVVSYTDDGLTLSLAARAASGQYLEGDEANLNARTSSYFVIGAATRYRLTPHLDGVRWGG